MAPTPSEILWAFVGGVVAAFGKYVQSWLTWKAIRFRAKRKLRDPNETNDPEQAIVLALAETEKPRVRSETLKLRRQMNGTGPYPTVKGERK